MARYYRRRYTRVVRPKKKWGSNIKSFTLSQNPAGTNGILHVTLAENSAQSSNPTPIIVKTGNFKIQGDCYTEIGGSPQIAAPVEAVVYVLYLPEGIAVTTYSQAEAVVQAHPEWIIAWKFVSNNVVYPTTPTTGENQSFTFSSRLKRNMNSGGR